MNNYTYGGFWRRSVAFMIDKCILFVISILLMASGSFITGASIPLDPDEIAAAGPIFMAYYGTMIVLNIVYFTYFHGATGQTPGKMALGLKVIQQTGAPMTFGVAFLRSIGYIISGLILDLGFAWIAFDGRKRGWHDMIASTYVIRTTGEKEYFTEP
ncbi:MAG: RDD family protein [Deltaproteobacteria bacterium]|nr:RDD family protein [Deltaproteobacteria bacterium]